MWHCIFESVYKFEQPSLGFFKEEEEKKSLIHTENLCLKPFF